MRKKKSLPEIKITIENSTGEQEEIVLDQKFIDLYHKESGRKKLTIKGISKFLNNFLKFHIY